MARIRVCIIEGEMTPAEVKEYADAFWRGDSNMPRAVATAEMQPDPVHVAAPVAAPAPESKKVPAKPKPVEVPIVAPAPEPVPVAITFDEPAHSHAPVAASTDDLMVKLVEAKRLNQIVQCIYDLGITDKDAVVAKLKEVRSAVPLLSRIPEDGLEDRLVRTMEGMK